MTPPSEGEVGTASAHGQRCPPVAAPVSDDAFAESGDVLLLNYPAELHPPARTALLGEQAFLGSAVRAERPDDEVAAWLARTGPAVVYVSLGSFLSVRSDVLARVAEALRGLDVRVALASGSTSRSALGPAPGSWLVRAELPQVTLLGHAALTVTHGGNNSVTEALAAGVPLLVLPMSTDQFAGSAALEEAGLGEVLDPNAATPEQIRAATVRLLDLPSDAAGRLTRLAGELTAEPGPGKAGTSLLADP